MKDWFPLTNYEFYAFVSAGMLLVASVDYCLAGGVLVNREEWSVVEVIFWTIVSYLAGHLCASASSIILEQFVTRQLLRSPTEIITGISRRRWIDHAVSFLAASRREYIPLPEPLRRRLLSRVSSAVEHPASELSAETVFETSFSAARANPDTAARLDQFLNSYGLCRNVSFVSFIGVALLARRYTANPNDQDLLLLISATVMAFGMYGRFFKYYSAYTREVLRIYANLNG
jgi:hypothetical protein